MVEIKCRTIPEPQEGTRSIYRKRNDNNNSSINEPLIQGNYGGELDYVCGNCTNILVQNVSQGEISTDSVFQCPKCQAYNEVYNVEQRPTI
jgi:DNA-directed RNA polymerase subunit RPC12/RpoP